MCPVCVRRLTEGSALSPVVASSLSKHRRLAQVVLFHQGRFLLLKLTTLHTHKQLTFWCRAHSF